MSWGRMGISHEQEWRKGPWTPEEDKLLTEYVNLHGEGRWSSVSRSSGLNRSGKSCRLRWVNYLRPGLKRGQITPQEEGIIIELHALWGNKWSTIARYLPGRTDNEIKNYWRTHFKKREKSTAQKKEKRKALLLKQRKQKQTKTTPPPPPTNENQEEAAVTVHPNAENHYQPSMYDNGVNNIDYQHVVDEEELWGGLWNLDDDDYYQPSHCNKFPGFGGDQFFNHLYNYGGYIF